ncbi:MAG: DNA alkylation response protein, partial [Xanthobacteraceae bacterium]
MSTEPFATHEVLNQSPPPGDVNLWTGDAALMGAVRAFGKPSKGDEEGLAAFGRRYGSVEMAALGRLANENPPKLKTFDSRGYHADVVEFHPSYHALMQTSMAAGLHASTWSADGTPAAANAHVLRAAKLHMAGEVEAGHLCPIVMTHAATAALLAEPALMKEWLPRIRARDYDASFSPAAEKTAVTLGMGMTEKQGGTDVRA